MTIAAVWEEDSFLFAVADTRLSQGSGKLRLTDSGPKLFSVPVTTRSLVGWPGRPGVHRRTLGALVVGDVAPALSTILSASTFLASLQSLDSTPPTLHEVSDFVSRVAVQLSRDYLGATAEGYGRFKIVLLGACPQTDELAVYEIDGRLDDQGHQMALNACDLGVVSVFGSGEDRFREEMGKLRTDGDDSGRTERLPVVAVENMLDDASALDVGGTPSVGWASRGSDFTLGWRVRPAVAGQPEAARYLNGFDLDDLGGPGACIIGGQGIA